MRRLGSAGPLVRALVLVSLSLLIVVGIYQVSGYSALDVLAGTWQGAVVAQGALESTARWATPLLLIALGVLVALRAGFFNVGAQGQFYVGATGALAVALAFPGAPPVIIVPLGFVAAAAAGAAYSLVPGFLRVRFGTDEVITTLMSNFVASLWLLYLTAGPLQDPSGTGESKASRVIDPAFRISDSSGVSPITILICVIALVTVWTLLRRSSFGITSGLSGRNPVMARWQGVDVARVGLLSFAISGGLAGIAGAVELFGPGGRLVSGFSPEVGFTAILVAVVGGLDVRGVAVAAVFFGGLQAALFYLPIVTPIPRTALDLLRGTLALLITITALPSLPRWRRAPAGPRAARKRT